MIAKAESKFEHRTVGDKVGSMPELMIQVNEVEVELLTMLKANGFCSSG